MAAIIIAIVIAIVIIIIIRIEAARRADFAARMTAKSVALDAEHAARAAARQPAAICAEVRLSQEEVYALQHRLWLEAEASAQVALCNLEAAIALRGRKDSWTKYSGAPTAELQVLVNDYESKASRAIALRQNWEEVKKRGW